MPRRPAPSQQLLYRAGQSELEGACSDSQVDGAHTSRRYVTAQINLRRAHRIIQLPLLQACPRKACMNPKSFLVFALVAAGVAAAYFWNSYLGLRLFEVAMVVALSLIVVDACPNPREHVCDPARP